MTTTPAAPLTLEAAPEIAAIREALDAGPTPGPWRASFDGHGGMRIESITWQIGYASKAGGRQEANAALLAACNPAAMTAVLATIAQIEARLREAEADVRRYRWLRMNRLWLKANLPGIAAPLFDDAIDAAIAAHGKDEAYADQT